MKLTLEDVSHVAFLARLDLEESEKQNLLGHLNKIIDHFSNLQDLDTTGIEPTDRVLPMVNVYRDDVTAESLDRDAILAAGFDTNHEAFLVPRVVDTADGKNA